MALNQISSPHVSRAGDTGSVMRHVLLATVPGIVVMTALFGWGTIVNILWASILAVSFEALAMTLRGRPPMFYIRDCSALVTAVLLGLALPAYAPWWLMVVGVGFSILIAKHLYGGMGYNPFNPAMVGYVVLLISFPLQMTQWAAPVGSVPDQAALLGPIDAVLASFGFLSSTPIDAYTMATPLDVFKQNNGLMVEELWATEPQFGSFGGYGWEWVNIAFLLGGAYLLYKRIFTWHAPVSMLLALVVMASLFYDGGSSSSLGSPLFHLFTGATMLGAFFIVTDPVSSAVSNIGRLYYGAGIGVLIFLIRSFGNYPDAIAFAVLLMNFAAPLIDHYTQPKVYGHSTSEASRGGNKS
ncbi:MAG: electron transport complex subunit RsxD [Pseudomonadales bacterium]